MTIVEIQVDMDCPGCESKIKKALKKLDGIDDIDVDMDMQKVTVMGWGADQEKVLKVVRRTGRTAELWPYPYNPEYGHNLNVQYYQQHPPRDGHHHYDHHHDNHSKQQKITTYKSIPSYSSYSYNYYEHGYSSKEHGYYQPPPYSTMFNEQDTAVFSDDNPHACSIM